MLSSLKESLTARAKIRGATELVLVDYKKTLTEREHLILAALFPNVRRLVLEYRSEYGRGLSNDLGLMNIKSLAIRTHSRYNGWPQTFSDVARALRDVEDITVEYLGSFQYTPQDMNSIGNLTSLPHLRTITIPSYPISTCPRQTRTSHSGCSGLNRPRRRFRCRRRA